MPRVKARSLSNLVETTDWWAAADPNDELYDEITGERWDALSYSYEDGADVPFHSEQQHKRIRQKARKTVRQNPYAENLLKNLVAWVIGKGHKYTVTARKNVEDKRRATEVSEKVQKFLDDLLELNKWCKRQKEGYRRLHRDGEAFFRSFPQSNGFTHFRWVEPGDITTPSKWRPDNSADYGIKTDPDDVETVEWYFIDGIQVDASEIQHRKSNVDMNVKRGLSSIYCIGANLNRGLQLLTNMSMLVQIQTSVAMIRKHDKTSQTVKNFATNSATLQTVNPVTGETRNLKRFRPGTILDTKKGTEYEFPAVGADPGAPVAVLGAELRAIASAHCLPEYMVGSDASNANYSSSMVAESPAVKFFEQEQADVIEQDLELFWQAIQHAVDEKVLPREAMWMLEIEVEPPTLVTRQPFPVAQTNEIYIRNRVKSPQTIASELGLDYRQEQKNWREFEDDTDTANLPLPGDLHGNASAPGSGDSGSELDQVLKICAAVASGDLTEDGATTLLRVMLGWKEERIKAMLPKARPSAPVSPGSSSSKGAPSNKPKVKPARPRAA
jgi:hypothetical protein